LEKAQAIGLFRFQLISPAIDDQLSTRARGVVVRGIAQGWHSDPFGNRVRYSRDTVDRWIRAWRQGGFAALVPSPRQTALRTDADIMEVAAALKRENPARTAAQVQRILVAAKGWAPSQSTLLRLFHRLELPGADGRTTGDAVFGRFEAGDPNELWTGDALHGRRVGGRKTYLFAFIDDHCAPRGASLYPRLSREELGGRLLGPMAYLKPKGEGDSSMPGNQRSCPGVERGVAGPARYG